MVKDFKDWAAWIQHDNGAPAAGVTEFVREVYDTHGPVPRGELELLWRARELELARAAVDLVAADICATTVSAPDIQVTRDKDNRLIVSYDGDYQSPSMFSLRAPESTCEVAENLRDHVMDDGWTPWPVCPAHGRGLSARPGDGEAVWVCPTGEHVVAAIGRLGSPAADGSVTSAGRAAPTS